jgi:hypothetical protein
MMPKLKQRLAFGSGVIFGFLLCYPNVVTGTVSDLVTDHYETKINEVNAIKVTDEGLSEILNPEKEKDEKQDP